MYLQVALVAVHQGPSSPGGGYLTFNGVTTNISKYIIETNTGPGGGFDYYEMAIVGASIYPPYQGYPGQITYATDSGTASHQEWYILNVPDDFPIPTNLQVYGRQLTSNWLENVAGNMIAHYLVGLTNPITTLIEQAKEAFWKFADDVGNHFGIANLGSSMERVETVRDSVSGIWDEALNVLNYGVGHFGQPDFDPALYNQQVDDLQSNSMESLVTALAELNGVGDPVKEAFELGRIVMDATAAANGNLSGSMLYDLAAPRDFQGTAVSDIVFDGAGSSHITGGAGNDILYGGIGDDLIDDGPGNDFVSGGSGDDQIQIGSSEGSKFSAVDFVSGGPGTDTLYIGTVGPGWSTGAGPQPGTPLAGNLVVNLQAGSMAAFDPIGGNQIYSGTLETIENVVTGAGNDHLIGSEDANRLDGGTGSDWLQGGGGNDYLINTGGSDTLEGGGGTDTLVYSRPGASAGMVIDLNLQNGNTPLALPDGTLISGMESIAAFGTSFADDVRGGDYNDVFYGAGGADTLFGRGGDDWMLGEDGDDYLDGGSGADLMLGDAGDDTYVVDNILDLPQPDVYSFGGVDEGYDTIVSTISFSLFFQNSFSYDTKEALILSGTDAINGTGNDFDNVITGNDAANRLSGLAGSDHLSGAGGNDVLRGGAGNDILTGGIGNDSFRDTADGLSGDTITDFVAGDAIIITDAILAGFTFNFSGNTLTYAGGSLTLTGVSGELTLSEASSGGVQLTIGPPVYNDVRNDFNGDGRSDILWRNSEGSIGDWLANTAGGYAVNNASITGVPNYWQIAGTGDFNGDGRDDILWRGEAGELGNWLATPGAAFGYNAAAGITSVPMSWQVAGIGDFNGDGRDDVLWRNSDGTIGNWLANANGSFAINNASLLQVPNYWHVDAIGDFNGDGRDDILWRGANGEVGNWTANTNGVFSYNVAAGLTTVSNSWQIAGVGDFNGDNRDDILWRDSDGTIGNWLANANGGHAMNIFSVTGAPNNWQVQGIGDYNGDGRDDILWREVGGEIGNWLATSSGTFFYNAAGGLNTVPNSWHIEPDIALV